MKFEKPTILFIVLGIFFVTNALIAEFIGVKIFQLESTLGFQPIDWQILGNPHLSLQLTCGVILWPVVFIMSDIINEYYGKRGVKLLSYLAAAMISFAFIIVYLSIHATPANFWINNYALQGAPDAQKAFQVLFGQGLWIIIGSLIAFLIGQLIDVAVFHWLKRKSNNTIWLRSTGSTLVSQLIDSFIVLFIAFYVGNNWSFNFVIAVCCINYLYKFTMAIILTPLLYLIHYLIRLYLGDEKANEMIAAAGKSN